MNPPRLQLAGGEKMLGLAGCVLASAVICRADTSVELSMAAAWDSSYVSEGRDNLEGSGLVSAAINVAWLGCGFSSWLAHGDSDNYREMNISVARTFAWGPVEFTPSYTRLEFGGDGGAPGDNELGLIVGSGALGDFQLEVGGRYSTEAKGAFVDLVVRRPFTAGTSGIIITPYLLQGLDYGYATEEHDGTNHLESGIAVAFPLPNGAILSTYYGHCWAQRDVHLEERGDVSWGGVSVTAAF